MRFLPFISGKLFLILYAIYSTVLVYVTSMYIEKKDKEDYMAESINKDEFFVLTQSYNIKHIFYYITYKLYDMKVLGRNGVKKRFYPCIRKSVDLQPLEKEVFNLYEINNGFVPKEFENNMVNENLFKEFYNNISSDLKNRGFYKSEKEKISIRNKLNITLLLVLVPSIWRCIGGITYGEQVVDIIIETIIITIISVFYLSEYRSDRLSGKGKASLMNYRKCNGYNKIDNRSSKESASYNVNINNNDDGVDNVISGAALGYIFGVNQINDSLNDNGDLCN